MCMPASGRGVQVRMSDALCDPGSWTVRSDHSITTPDGLCLDVSGASTQPGAAVISWTCTGRANQQWTFHPGGAITSDASGLCLDITGGSVASGAPVEVWSCNGKPHQLWSYSVAPYPYSLISATVGGGNLTEAIDGGLVMSPDQSVHADMQWTFLDGLLQNAVDGRCLEASRTTVFFTTCDPKRGEQHWDIQPNDGAIELTNWVQGGCLNPPAGDTHQGTVTNGTCTNTSTWRITPNLTSTPADNTRSYIPTTTPGAE